MQCAGEEKGEEGCTCSVTWLQRCCNGAVKASAASRDAEATLAGFACSPAAPAPVRTHRCCCAPHLPRLLTSCPPSLPPAWSRRPNPPTPGSLRGVLRYLRLETFLVLLGAFFINLCVICVFAEGFYGTGTAVVPACAARSAACMAAQALFQSRLPLPPSCWPPRLAFCMRGVLKVAAARPLLRVSSTSVHPRETCHRCRPRAWAGAQPPSQHVTAA